MEFWVKVFDSFHQRQEDEIDKFQRQADILFDAFCWAKIVLGRMDGYPIDYPRHDALGEAEKSILRQRMAL